MYHILPVVEGLGNYMKGNLQLSHAESTSSHQKTGVKPKQTSSVPRWVIAYE